MLKKSLAAAVILGLAATSAQAFEVSGYLQGNVGQSKADKPKFIKQELLGDYTKTDRKDTAYKLIVGLQLNPYMALEAQYTDLGKAEYKHGFSSYAGKMDIKTKGLGANIVGTLPINKFKLFAKAGLHKLKAELSDKDNAGYSYSKSGNKWTQSYGVGASYEIINNFEILAEYEYFRNVGDTKARSGTTGNMISLEHDIDYASVGIRYKF